MTTTLDTPAGGCSGSVDPQAPATLLTSDVQLNEHPQLDLDVTPELCRSLYRDMVLGRRFDQEAHNLQRQGELGLWLSCQGQEAAQVGSIRAVAADDHVFPAYREHAAALCRGLQPAELLSQWRGTAHGSWDPSDYRFHIYTLVLATQLLHAVGYAIGVKADRSGEVVLAYFGDGSASQGDANEALNWAAVTNAPVIFFCQNNQWAISTPATSQSKTPLHQRAAGFGLISTAVDGNDVLAVHAATKAAADRVRTGGGPEFIEAITYRMAGHSTSDDPKRYRDDAEVESWRQLDPITGMRSLLDAQDWADEQFHADLDAAATALASETRAACMGLQPPRLEATFANTLVEETPLIRAERERFTAYLESFL